MKNTDAETIYDIEFNEPVHVLNYKTSRSKHTKVCKILKEAVKIEKRGKHTVANWSDLIDENWDLCQEYAKQHWEKQQEDEDMFVFYFIKQLDEWFLKSDEEVYELVKQFKKVN